MIDTVMNGKKRIPNIALGTKKKNPDLHKTQSRTAETYRRQNDWLISTDLSFTQIGLIKTFKT
jgi:hypothetical protein